VLSRQFLQDKFCKTIFARQFLIALSGGIETSSSGAAGRRVPAGIGLDTDVSRKESLNPKVPRAKRSHT
jgi:hypothetical protein